MSFIIVFDSKQHTAIVGKTRQQYTTVSSSGQHLVIVGNSSNTRQHNKEHKTKQATQGNSKKHKATVSKDRQVQQTQVLTHL